jgi:hypothetical protein
MNTFVDVDDRRFASHLIGAMLAGVTFLLAMVANHELVAKSKSTALEAVHVFLGRIWPSVFVNSTSRLCAASNAEDVFFAGTSI